MQSSHLVGFAFLRLLMQSMTTKDFVQRHDNTLSDIGSRVHERSYTANGDAIFTQVLLTKTASLVKRFRITDACIAAVCLARRRVGG